MSEQENSAGTSEGSEIKPRNKRSTNRGGKYKHKNGRSERSEGSEGSKKLNNEEGVLQQTVKSTVDKTDEQNSDIELCFICANPIIHRAVYPCNHVTCHECTLRLRALMHNKACVQCRTDRDNVIISDNLTKRYGDFSPSELIYKDTKLSILFDSLTTKQEVLSLLKFNCPIKDCHHVCTGWKDLKNHIRNVHKRRLCDLCSRHRNVFTVELDTYTDAELNKHERFGDSKTGFPGHPQCQFCHIRFYSDDELFVHCRDKHEKCFICERHNPSTPQYYKNYESLENHFREKHFLCNVQSCLDQKFVVFEDEIGLHAHRLETHASLFGTSKESRIINTNFSYSRPSFGSQLSTIPSTAVSTAANSSGPTTITSSTSHVLPPDLDAYSSEAFPELGVSRTSRPTPIPTSHRVDTSSETRKKRLEERARIDLNYDMNKFQEFSTLCQRFQLDTIQPKSLVYELNQLFQIPTSEMEVIVYEIALLNQKTAPLRSSALRKAFDGSKLSKLEPLPRVVNASGSWVTPNNARNSSIRNASSFPPLPTASKVQTAAPARVISPRPLNSSALSASILSGGSSTRATSSVPSSPRLPSLQHSSSSVSLRPLNNSNTGFSRTSSAISLQDFPSLPGSNVKRHPMVRPPPVINSQWEAPIINGGSSTETSTQNSDREVEALAAKKKGKKKQLLFRMGV